MTTSKSKSGYTHLEFALGPKYFHDPSSWCLWGNAVLPQDVYHRGMTEAAALEVKEASGHTSRYTRNNPYFSTVTVNRLLTGSGSEKETRHIEMTLEEGMNYTPGDAVGIIPENRAEA